MNPHIHIHLPTQHLELLDAHNRPIAHYPISTARNGAGETMHSECTPRGPHIIRAKIGTNAPINSIFIARRLTGEIYHPALRTTSPTRDWILTRILWLSGCQPGINRLGHVDSMRRYIYIHGTPDDTDITTPGSRGCIRMKNRDIINLFNQINTGTPVTIQEY